MGRRRNNILNEETLSKESNDVQDKSLEDLMEDNRENDVNPGSNKIEDMNNLLNKKTKETKEKPRKEKIFRVGDYVKLNKDIKFDLLGRRIHPGLRNYKYRILSIRVDGMLIIECLTHCFTVQPTDVEEVQV